MEIEMVLVCLLRLMDQYIWGSGKMDYIMIKVYICIRMGRDIRGRFVKDLKEALVRFFILMVISMKESGVRILGRVWVK